MLNRCDILYCTFLKRNINFSQYGIIILALPRGDMRDQRIDKLEKRMTAARCSIDTIIYMVMPALPESREPIGFHA